MNMEKAARGRFYGVGVGPGDPEEMTLKAVRVLREADLILLPSAEKEKCIAYQIAVRSLPELEQKELLCRSFPMKRDEQALARAHDEIFGEVRAYLEKGKSVALVTLGDPCIYSAYSYIRSRMQKAGYIVETVNGIPSFCSAAARLGISLANWSEQIHIIPGETDPKESGGLTGTRIFMKSGKQLPKLKEALAAECEHRELQIWCVSNCGMENEIVGYGLQGINTEAGYLTLIIVKEAVSKSYRTAAPRAPLSYAFACERT